MIVAVLAVLLAAQAPAPLNPFLDPAQLPLDQSDPFAGCLVSMDAQKNRTVNCGDVITGSVRRDVTSGMAPAMFAAAKAGLERTAKGLTVTGVDGPVRVGAADVPGHVLTTLQGPQVVGLARLVVTPRGSAMCSAVMGATEARWDRCPTLLAALLAADPAVGPHPLRVLGTDIMLPRQCTLWARNRIKCLDGDDVSWSPSAPGEAPPPFADLDAGLKKAGLVVERTESACQLGGVAARCSVARVQRADQRQGSITDAWSPTGRATCVTKGAGLPPLCKNLIQLQP